MIEEGRMGDTSFQERDPSDAFVRSHTRTANSMKDEELPSKFSSERKMRRWNS